MSDKKVNIISKVDCPITVTFPELHFSRSWERKGAVKAIDYEIVQEGMSDPGFQYMINTGMLYIEDMEVKKDLDIEPEDAKKPVNVIVYSDGEIKELLTTKTPKQLENALKKISEEQIHQIAREAIDMKISDLEKCRILQEYSGLDIVKQIGWALEDEKEAETTKSKKTSKKK